ncbi:MAG: restriction endonuclease subunit S, partial [Hoeflea sp.]|nr:restriction endonuclease subunit S [Hoeflea sp.]
MSELPLGWVETELGDIFQVQSGFAFKSNEYTDRGHFLVRIANVQDGYLTLDKPKYVELPEALRRFELREGDILTSLTGNIGRVAEVEACHLPAALNQRVARLSLSGQEPHKPYLIWFLRTSAFSGFLEEKSHGAAQLNVSPSAVAEVPLPLPPLTEQKRIVAKLDALATKSARARTDLARIDTLVTRYKQAVLSKAFDLSPNSSCIEFREYIQAANNGLSKRSGDQGELINVLRLADLDEAVFSPGEPRKIRMSEKELEKYRLHSMDLVVIRVNGSSNLVGRAF